MKRLVKSPYWAPALSLVLAISLYFAQRVTSQSAKDAISTRLGLPFSAEIDVTVTGTLRLDNMTVGDKFRAQTISVHPSLNGSLAQVIIGNGVYQTRRGTKEEGSRSSFGSGLLDNVDIGGSNLLVLFANGRLQLDWFHTPAASSGQRPIALKGRVQANRGDTRVTLETLSLRGMLSNARIQRGVGYASGDVHTELFDYSVPKLSIALSGDVLRFASINREHGALEGEVVLGERPSVVATARGLSLRSLRLDKTIQRHIDTAQAIAHGDIRLSEHDDHWVVAVDGVVHHLLLQGPMMAEHTIPVSPRLSGEFDYYPREQYWQTTDTMVALEHLRGALTLDVHASSPPTLQLKAQLPTQECQQAYLSLPAGLRSELAGLQLTGSISGDVLIRIDSQMPDASRFSISSRIGCQTSSEPLYASSILAGVITSHPASPNRSSVASSYVPLIGLPTYVPDAFVAAEDARFYWHSGFDPRQIQSSLRINIEKGRLARGGSTISQQLAKNLFLSPERSVPRKLQEVILTWRLENRLTKAQILERYLNLVELGPDHFGISEGSEYWFAKAPGQLSVLEAAFLAAITPAPKTFTRQILDASGALPDDMRDRVNLVLRAMARSGAITWPQYHTLKNAPLALHTEKLASRLISSAKH